MPMRVSIKYLLINPRGEVYRLGLLFLVITYSLCFLLFVVLGYSLNCVFWAPVHHSSASGSIG